MAEANSDVRREVAECFCLNLRMSSRALSQIYDEALRPLGLKTTQFSLLRGIQRLAPVTFQALADRMVLDQTTLPRSLRLLERGGYIRIEHGSDRRERLASLTAKGRETLERALPFWRKAQERVRANFTPKRLENLMIELAAIRRATAES